MLPMFSSFQVLHWGLWPIQSSFLCRAIDMDLRSFFCMLTYCFSAPFVEDASLSPVCVSDIFVNCHRALLLCSIDLHACFGDCTILFLFIYCCGSVIYLWNLAWVILPACYFCLGLFGYPGYFVVPYEFYSFFLSFVKNVVEILIEIESLNSFW